MLNEHKFYMNPHTGSVDTGQIWMLDFNQRDSHEGSTWEEWGGDSLIEVEKNEDGDWIEV